MEDNTECTREHSAVAGHSTLAAAPPKCLVAEGRSAESLLAQASHPKQEEVQEVVGRALEDTWFGGILLSEEQYRHLLARECSYAGRGMSSALLGQLAALMADQIVLGACQDAFHIGRHVETSLWVEHTPSEAAETAFVVHYYPTPITKSSKMCQF